MNKLKISRMTFGQARVRGITKKNWLRSLRISASLKKYKETGLTKKQRKDKISLTTDRKRIKEDKKPLKRIRRQVAQNFRTTEPPYFASIRAVTINPEITQRGLNMALIKVKNKVQREESLDISGMESDYVGLEMTEIPPTEDKKLNDNRVHVEVFFAYLDGRKEILRYYIL